jgi:hypothetical protein
VPPAPLNADTDGQIERLQIEAWRRMTPAEKAAIVTGLTEAAIDLALAGIRDRYPDATPREQFLRLAIVRLGSDLACQGVSRRGASAPAMTLALDPIAVVMRVIAALDTLRTNMWRRWWRRLLTSFTLMPTPCGVPCTTVPARI